MHRACYVIPCPVPSAANLREHWAAKARRVKWQRQVARLITLDSAGVRCAGAAVRKNGGTITLARISPRKLDSDNLASSLKAIRDGIAEAIEVDDGDARIAWKYEQEKGGKGAQTVRVLIEAAA